MSTRATAPSEKPKVSMPVVIIAIIVTLAVIGGIVYKTLGPSLLGPSSKTIPVTPDAQWIIDKAQASGGDFNKLSADDQKRLQTITRGMGPMALAGAYKSHPK